MSDMREQLEGLRRPFDKKFNDALDRVLLFLPPFEVLEAHIEGLGFDIEGLEERIEKLEQDERSDS